MGHKRKSEKSEKKEKKQKVEQLIPKDQVNAFLKENEITVTDLKGEDASINPILSFDQYDFPKRLLKALKKFPKPTPIQSVSWPLVLSGKDLVGVSATGSGKTLAFGIPCLIDLLRNPNESKKPVVLILSPTRELALQIQEQFIEFGTKCSVTSVCIYGGVPKYEQKKELSKGMDIIVATPGRLIDLFEEDENLCDLSSVKYLVLDEADRMLDQGFHQAITKIIAKCPSQRQTVMFSATWPTEIQRMALTHLKSPLRITVGSTELSANNRIEQRVEVIDPYGKENRLLALLRDYHSSRKNRILIFALYKKEAARLESLLKRNGYKVGAIHGDLSQQQRTMAIQGFKSGNVPLLIATDVAARGIDIPNVEYVINVTFPLTIEDYCHRIGRSGRAGATGISHTFFTLHDKAHSGSLINILKQANQVVPEELMKFGTTVKKKVDPNYGAFFKEIDPNVKGTKIKFDD